MTVGMSGSEIDRDAVFFPIAIAGRIRAVAATPLFGALVRRGGRPARLGLGQSAFGRGRQSI